MRRDVVAAMVARDPQLRWLPGALRDRARHAGQTVVVLDRPTEAEVECCLEHGAITIPHFPHMSHEPTTYGADGVATYEEGRLRSLAWYVAETTRCPWVLLGDVDETIDGDVGELVDWAARERLEVVYASHVNLVDGDAAIALGEVVGEDALPRADLYEVVGAASPWSWEHPQANRVGLLARAVRPTHLARSAPYDTAARSHVRREPWSIARDRAAETTERRYSPDVRVLHWHYVPWRDYERTEHYHCPKHRAWWAQARLRPWLKGD